MTDYEDDYSNQDHYRSPNDEASDWGELREDQEERTVKKMNEEKGYPKFQWSIFVKNGKEQQFVIRADTIEEFKQAKQDILSLIGEAVVTDIPKVQIAGSVTRTSGQPGDNGMYCMTCKKPATQKQGVSKSGKPYNAIFCSTEDRSHTKWL